MEPHVLVMRTGEAVLIDESDVELVSKYRWHVKRSNSTNVYAYAYYTDENGNPQWTFMHRLIMNPPDRMVVDHINGCGLDNRRANLRVCTQAFNNTNRRNTKYSRDTRTVDQDTGTGIIGASLLKNGTYRSYVSVGCKQHHLGSYPSAEEAGIAHDRAALHLFGMAASLNFPDKDLDAECPRVLRAQSRVRGQSVYMGVNPNARGWVATIRRDQHTHYLGTFSSEEEAAIARDRVALHFGFSKDFLNFPDRDLTPCTPEMVKPAMRVRGAVGYLGVTKKHRRFTARFMMNRKYYRLGVFDTAEEAARAYDAAARFFGEERSLNFPNEQIPAKDPNERVYVN